MREFPLVILSALALAGCTDYKKPIADVIHQAALCGTNSILEVHSKAEIIEAMKKGQAKDIFNKETLRYFSADRYVAALQKIDVSKCPKDFQGAWVDYLVAWEKQNNFNPKPILILQSAVAVYESQGINFIADGKSIEQLSGAHGAGISQLTVAAQAVKQCAENHGVNF